MTGLLAAAPIKWLLDSEVDVRNAVRAFVRGEHEPVISVAGPPTDHDLTVSRIFGRPTPLPCVLLRLRMVDHHLTGLPHVEVTATDREIDEIEDWRQRALRKAAERLQDHLRTRPVLSPLPSC